MDTWCWPRRCEYAARPIIILLAPIAFIVFTLANTGFLVMASHTNGNPTVIYLGGSGSGSGTTVYTLTNATGTLFLLGVGITLLEYVVISLLVLALYFGCCCSCRLWCCCDGDCSGDGDTADDTTEIELNIQQHLTDSNGNVNTITLADEHNRMDNLIFDSDTPPSDDGDGGGG